MHPFLPFFELPSSFESSLGRTPSVGGWCPLDGYHLPERTIALDYAASTPVDLRVLAAMRPWLLSYFGNPAARIHPFGDLSDQGLAGARQQFAELLGVGFEEVLFTSSATEANNLVLRGLVCDRFRKRNKIIFGATEHASIVATAEALAERGGEWSGIEAARLPMDTDGQVDLAAASRLIDEKTLCVCLMDVNNETGIVQSNLAAVMALARARGALVHVDAVQGFVRGDFATRRMPWDTLVIASGKVYGPRGAAVLAVRKRTPAIRLRPQLTGGGQEFGVRSSTVNLPSIIGFAEAARLQEAERAARNSHLAALEQRFLDSFLSQIDARIYGTGAKRVPGIIMMAVPGVNALKLIEVAGRVAVGVGSACRALHASASHVLLEMGVELEYALASFRVSIGLPNTSDEMVEAAAVLAAAAKAVRRDSAAGI